MQDVMIDEEVLKQLKAGLLLASAAGILIHLKEMEPAKHTKRYRELGKVEDAMIKLFELYPLCGQFDITDLGARFFDAEHDARLKQMMEEGVEILPPSEEELAEAKAKGRPAPLHRAVFRDRWQTGDRLKKGNRQIIIVSFEGDQYHFREGAGIYYSKTAEPKDPYLLFWKRITP
jgi:hypothetical protein